MTDPIVDRQPENHEAEALADAVAGRERAPLDALAAATADHPTAHRMDEAAHRGGSARRRGATGLARRVPAALAATEAGAQWTINALQSLPDSTLRALAATSVGFGAGLSFTRAGRLAAVAGMVPAMVMGTAIAVRHAGVSDETARVTETVR